MGCLEPRRFSEFLEVLKSGSIIFILDFIEVVLCDAWALEAHATRNTTYCPKFEKYFKHCTKQVFLVGQLFARFCTCCVGRNDPTLPSWNDILASHLLFFGP